ncbi:hypothetical protein SAMN02745121_04530 [Nannocystis exedens]|uniref:Uncharacterized protein n=1 Tax=Nannocystis exedens TaxID=54 RepID=A0A1I2B8K0_9BACT|nr:hypothetical protein [Nannocystis exedens]PCC68125.1 hypothetical protein NAEX_01134 [Nannocystis exedens]SFE52484.1 hypothetical protein SAMN02745121_04530 [Nannocystis exedens]
MLRSRIVAVAAAVSLGGLALVPGYAAASPYLVDFAARGDNPADDVSTDVREAIVEQVPMGEALPAPRAPPALAAPPEDGLGLLITGFSMFTASYLLAAWTGALVHDGLTGCNGTREQCREIGKALMIPFAGPIMAAQEIDGVSETASLFLVSSIQIATFTVGLVGAVRQWRYKRWERRAGGLPLGESGLAVQPMPRLDGGGLGLHYRF